MSKINRIDNASFFRLAEALNMPVGTILDGIEGLRVTSVDQRKENDGKKGPYSIQRLHVSDGRDKSSVQAWNFPDLSNLNGSIINLESTLGRDNAPHGVMIDEYQGEIRIKLSESGIIDNMEDAKTSPENQWQNVEAHNGVFGGGGQARPGPQQRGGRQQAPAQQRGGGRPAQRQQTPTRGPADRHEKRPIFGATVGMAINQAASILREAPNSVSGTQFIDYYLSRQFSIDLYTLSSDILRVAERLERGDIAMSAKQREEAARVEPEPQPEQEAPKARGRQQREAPPPEEEPPIEPSYQADMDDSDIPF